MFCTRCVWQPLEEKPRAGQRVDAEVRCRGQMQRPSFCTQHLQKFSDCFRFVRSGVLHFPGSGRFIQNGYVTAARNVMRNATR